MKIIIIALIKIYQRVISPFTPRTCRFYPTCSAYTLSAVKKYGVFKGSWLGLKRLLSCHPFNPGGYDPLE